VKWYRKHKYGLSEEGFNQLLAAQAEVCAICKKSLEVTMEIDHDHVTGKVRGLLCSRCNSGLGLFGDDPVVVRNALQYVARYRGLTSDEVLEKLRSRGVSGG
jgi:hypothetical protein